MRGEHAEDGFPITWSKGMSELGWSTDSIDLPDACYARDAHPASRNPLPMVKWQDP